MSREVGAFRRVTACNYKISDVPNVRSEPIESFGPLRRKILLKSQSQKSSLMLFLTYPSSAMNRTTEPLARHRLSQLRFIPANKQVKPCPYIRRNLDTELLLEAGNKSRNRSEKYLSACRFLE